MTKKVNEEMSLGDLDQVTGGASINEMKAEASAKFDIAMAAATAQLITGTAVGVSSAASAFTPSTSTGKRK